MAESCNLIRSPKSTLFEPSLRYIRPKMKRKRCKVRIPYARSGHLSSLRVGETDPAVVKAYEQAAVRDGATYSGFRRTRVEPQGIRCCTAVARLHRGSKKPNFAPKMRTY